MITDILTVLGGYDFDGDINKVIRKLEDIRDMHDKHYIKIRLEYDEFDGDYTVLGIREKTDKDVELELNLLKD